MIRKESSLEHLPPPAWQNPQGFISVVAGGWGRSLANGSYPRSSSEQTRPHRMSQTNICLTAPPKMILSESQIYRKPNPGVGGNIGRSAALPTLSPTPGYHREQPLRVAPPDVNAMRTDVILMNPLGSATRTDVPCGGG